MTDGAREAIPAALRFAAVSAALWVVRVYLLADLPESSPETCHTGAIASDLLDHGMRFPFRAYTPETYENGIVLEGIFAAPLFALLGRNLLALKVLAHAFASISAVMGLSLLERVLDDLGATRRSTRAAAQAAYLVLTAFAPRLFSYKMLDALGDHNEATALTMVLLVLFARDREAPSRARLIALWGCAGFFAFWEKGTLMATALAAVHSAMCAWRERALWRRTAVSAAIFLVAYAPGIHAHLATGFADASTVASKFVGDLPSALRHAALTVFVSRVMPPALLGYFATLFYLARTGWKMRGTRALLPYLAAYVFLHLALVLYSKSDLGFYYLYGFPVVILVPAVWVARGGERLAARRSLAPWMAHAACTALLAVGLLPDLRFDLGHVRALRAERDRAVCHWRFGRAFWLSSPDAEAALARCRVFGGDETLACVSGIAYGNRPIALRAIRDPRERAAFVFGVGRSSIAANEEGTCEMMFTRPDDLAMCANGRRWEWLFYQDLIEREVCLPSFGRPMCDVEVPFGGFEVSQRDRWMRRPPTGMRGAHPDDRRSEDVASACFPGRVRSHDDEPAPPSTPTATEHRR